MHILPQPVHPFPLLSRFPLLLWGEFAGPALVVFDDDGEEIPVPRLAPPCDAHDRSWLECAPRWNARRIGDMARWDGFSLPHLTPELNLRLGG